SQGVVSSYTVNGKDLNYNMNAFNLFYSNPPTIELLSHSANRTANRINITVSGSGFPANGMYSIGLTAEMQYENYVQVSVIPLLYRMERGNSPIGAAEYEYLGKVFRTLRFSMSTATCAMVYLLLPDEMPFIPDESYFVRVISHPVNKVEKVLGV